MGICGQCIKAPLHVAYMPETCPREVKSLFAGHLTSSLIWSALRSSDTRPTVLLSSQARTSSLRSSDTFWNSWNFIPLSVGHITSAAEPAVFATAHAALLRQEDQLVLPLAAQKLGGVECQTYSV